MATDAPALPAVPGTASPQQVRVMTVIGGPAFLPAISISPYSVMAIPAVYRGVNWLAGTIAGLPLAVVRETGRVYQNVAHPLNRLLSRRINPVTIPFVFWETYFHHCILWGNGYGLIARDTVTTAPKGVVTLNPEAVTPFNWNGSRWYLVKGLNPTAKDPKDRDGIVPGADMLHVPGLGFDGMQGYPLVDLLAETFEWARNLQRFGNRYLKKGTQIQGAIEVPSNVDDEQIALIRNQIRERHSGMEADYSHLLLGGGAKLNNATIDPQKSQLNETKAESVVDIARVLGVPPWYLYEMGDAKWANVEQQALDAVKYSLRPWLLKAEQEGAAKLLTESERDAGLMLRFDVEDLTRGDAKSISDRMIAEVNAGIRTPNEGRAEVGLPPDKDPEADKRRAAAPGQGPTPPAGDTKPKEATP